MLISILGDDWDRARGLQTKMRGNLEHAQSRIEILGRSQNFKSYGKINGVNIEGSNRSNDLSRL